MSNDTNAKIAELNDTFRKTGIGGQIFITQGVNALPQKVMDKIITEVKNFDDFNTDKNDPYGQHDFGSVEVEGQNIFWKIDYYAPDMMHGSEDPTNAEITRRVLTIMLASEY